MPLLDVDRDAPDTGYNRKERRAIKLSGLLMAAVAVVQVVIGLCVLFYLESAVGTWWAGVLAVLVGLLGLRTNTKCRILSYSVLLLVALVCFCVAAIFDFGLYSAIHSFEACADDSEYKRCEESIVFCQPDYSPDYFASKCAHDNDAACGCIDSDGDCYVFDDAYSCPGLQDTFTDLLMTSGALCIVGAATALLSIMTVCGCGLNLCAGRTRSSRTRTASATLPTVAIV